MSSHDQCMSPSLEFLSMHSHDDPKQKGMTVKTSDQKINTSPHISAPSQSQHGVLLIITIYPFLFLFPYGRKKNTKKLHQYPVSLGAAHLVLTVTGLTAAASSSLYWLMDPSSCIRLCLASPHSYPSPSSSHAGDAVAGTPERQTLSANSQPADLLWPAPTPSRHISRHDNPMAGTIILLEAHIDQLAWCWNTCSAIQQQSSHDSSPDTWTVRRCHNKGVVAVPNLQMPDFSSKRHSWTMWDPH